MALVDPAHPGALIRETLKGIFEETGKKLTVAEVAAGLGTTRKLYRPSSTASKASRLKWTFV